MTDRHPIQARRPKKSLLSAEQARRDRQEHAITLLTDLRVVYDRTWDMGGYVETPTGRVSIGSIFTALRAVEESASR